MVTGLFALLTLGFALGLRHGIDWDHIAAITDITSSSVSNKAAVQSRPIIVTPDGSVMSATVPLSGAAIRRTEVRQGFFLATMYALGHATLVVALGLLAIWIGAILPDWIDPIMERIVGVTLLVLGFYIFYSIWRYGSSFQLRSRWMLVFELIGQGWNWTQNRLFGKRLEHRHPNVGGTYGWRAAYSIGVIHGVGAETGSQALLLASAAGATTAMTGSLLLLFFTVGLLVSNSLVALFSLASFISSSTKRNVYLAIGGLAGVFSLIVGVFFLLGRSGDLPDLQQLLDSIFGAV